MNETMLNIYFSFELSLENLKLRDPSQVAQLHQIPV